MSWQILVVISVLTFSSSTILQRILLKNDKSDPIAFSIIFQLLVGFIIAIFALIRGFQMPNFMQTPLNFLLLIILYTGANIYIFKGIKNCEASEFTVLFATRTFWTVLGAVLFLRETFTLKQFIGLLMILVSIFLISWKKHKININKGHLYSLIGAIFFGLGFVNDAVILKGNIDVFSYLSFSFTLPAIAIWLLYPKTTKKMSFLFSSKIILRLLFLGFIYSISALTIFSAYQIGRNAAQIGVLAQTSTILTALLGIFLLNEKAELFKKIISSFIAFIGVILTK